MSKFAGARDSGGYWVMNDDLKGDGWSDIELLIALIEMITQGDGRTPDLLV
jgi:hypothetical protein